MDEFYAFLIIVVVVFTGYGVRLLAFWWNRKQLKAAGRNIKGHAIDVALVMPRLAEVRRSFREAVRARQVDLRRRVRRVEMARRAVRRLSFFQAHSQNGLGPPIRETERPCDL